MFSPLGVASAGGESGRDTRRGECCTGVSSACGSRTGAGDIVRTGEKADTDDGVSARVKMLIGGWEHDESEATALVGGGVYDWDGLCA